ncbi:hypothetical protein C8J56DRAFT_1056283 [Mycena floridula]|nr:hypothetical protein C8J56DRAFT_1056283 [Mycena floridula]
MSTLQCAYCLKPGFTLEVLESTTGTTLKCGLCLKINYLFQNDKGWYIVIEIPVIIAPIIELPEYAASMKEMEQMIDAMDKEEEMYAKDKAEEKSKENVEYTYFKD